jgi:hypothetical protein
MIPGERIGVSLTGGFSFVTALDEGGMGFMIESTLLSGSGWIFSFTRSFRRLFLLRGCDVKTSSFVS